MREGAVWQCPLGHGACLGHAVHGILVLEDGEEARRETGTGGHALAHTAERREGGWGGAERTHTDYRSTVGETVRLMIVCLGGLR